MEEEGCGATHWKESWKTSGGEGEDRCVSTWQDQEVERAGQRALGVTTGHWVPPLALLPPDAKHRSSSDSSPSLPWLFMASSFNKPNGQSPGGGSRGSTQPAEARVVPVLQLQRVRSTEGETCPARLKQVVSPCLWLEAKALGSPDLPSTLLGGTQCAPAERS